MDTQLQDIAKKLRTLDRTDIRNWLKRGELLTQARSALGNDAGFVRWCKDQKIAKTTAYKAMAAFRDFGNVPTSGQFSKESMAILSQSPEAREDAIDLSKHKRISARIARDLVRDYIETDAPSAKAPTGYQEVFRFDDITIIVKADREPLNADLMGALAAAAKQVRGGLVRAA